MVLVNNVSQILAINSGVPLGGIELLMSENHLNMPYVTSGPQQMSTQAVPETVAGDYGHFQFFANF